MRTRYSNVCCTFSVRSLITPYVSVVAPFYVDWSYHPDLPVVGLPVGDACAVFIVGALHLRSPLELPPPRLLDLADSAHLADSNLPSLS